MPPSDATLGRAGSMSNASGRSVSPATNRRCVCGYCAPSSFCTCASSPAPSTGESLGGLQRSSSQMSLTSAFSSKQLRKQASSTRLDQGAFFYFRQRLAFSCTGLMLVMLCVALASRHLQHASVDGLERVPPFRDSRRMMMSADDGISVSTGTTAVIQNGLESTGLALPKEVIPNSPLGGPLLEAPARKYNAIASQMKIYIYDLPSYFNADLVTRDPRILTHMFAAEVLIHYSLMNSSVRTMNPDEADLFFIPVYSTGDLNDQGRALPQMAGMMIKQVMHHVVHTWPFFNRTHGSDHVVVVPHDFGACFTFREEEAVTRKVPAVLRKLLMLQTFGQENHTCSRSGRSIIIPPYVNVNWVKSVPGLPEGPGQPPRDKFAYFRGLVHDFGNDPWGNKYSKGVRYQIWKHHKDNPLFDVAEMVPFAYYEDMRRSVFCLCPLGWAPWSPRIVESLQQGCIPVIISDNIILPFREFVDWPAITVHVPEKDVPRLDEILSAIPVEEVAAMQKRIWSPAVRRAVLFPQPAEEGDAFHYVLRELARKLEQRREAQREKDRKSKSKKKSPTNALRGESQTAALHALR